VALNLVPHFSLYTVPTLAVGGLCLAWRFLYEFQKVPLPNLFTKIGLVLALTYLVYENYGQILGLESGSALLICAVSLKLIDHVGYRDAMILLFLNFMLLLSRFLESQTLGITIFSAFDLIITTALLIQLHNGSRIKFDFWSLLKMGSKLFLQITPFMILLFFVFPRFSGNFIKSGANQKSTTGFKESLDPGSVESLAQSDQVAFRTQFYNQPVNIEDMYWRGSVLSESHGMTWSKGIQKLAKVKEGKRNFKNLLKHEVLLEPLFDDWLFAIDRPVFIEQRSLLLQKMTDEKIGSIFFLNKNYDKKFVYDAYSTDEFKESLDPIESNEVATENYLKIYLNEVDQSNQNLFKLVENLKDKSQDDEAIAHKLMNFYQKNFKYTLSPGKLKTNSLSEFLFETKIGFCEHFAASFASIMRMTGVPSRVVIGFQGGIKNQYSNYYMITTKDAHAWAEIWSKEKQLWIRFDPTEVVAPLRLRLGGEVYHSLSESERLKASQESYFLANFKNDWFNKSLLAIDAVSTNWNLFLLSYNDSGQKSFFAKFGFENINQNMLLIYSLLILLLYFLWVRLKNKPKDKKESKAQIAYLKFRKKFEKRGIIKEANEGPRDFLLRCQSQFPQFKNEISEFSNLYLESQFGHIHHGKEFKILRKIKP
jgi:protein-glutamine gamma-glutamyltransferase